MLTVIDEHSRECLALHVQRKLNSDDVLVVLTGLFARHGPPAHIRSDNGAEFTAHAVRDWLSRIGVKTLYIEPGSPWENGYNESFNGKRVITGSGVWKNLKYGACLAEIVFVWKSKEARGARHTWQKIL